MAVLSMTLIGCDQHIDAREGTQQTSDPHAVCGNCLGVGPDQGEETPIRSRVDRNLRTEAVARQSMHQRIDSDWIEIEQIAPFAQQRDARVGDDARLGRQK